MKTLLFVLFVSAAAAQMRTINTEAIPPGGADRDWPSAETSGFGEATAPCPDVHHAVTEAANELFSRPAPVNSNHAGWKNGNSESATISVARLRHKPTRAAVKAFARAQKFSEAKDYNRAAAALREAIAADPAYAQAHANLGAQYLRLSRLDEAEVEFRTAIALDSRTGLYYSNLAMVLQQKNQIPEAQESARRAVALDSANPKSRLVLGWLLAEESETQASAIPHLEYAARQIPEAHRILADLYRLAGKATLEAQESQRYRDAAATARVERASAR